MRLNGTVRVEMITESDLIGSHRGTRFQFVIPEGLKDCFAPISIGDRVKILAEANRENDEKDPDYFIWEVILAWKIKSDGRLILLMPEPGAVKRDPQSRSTNARSVPCFCVRGEERREYRSFSEAAEEHGVSVTTIGNRVKNLATDRAGWKWLRGA